MSAFASPSLPMLDRRSFLSASIQFQGVLDFLIFLALSGSWLGLLGRWHWTLDLFSHFRWQYFIICFLALVWTLFRRRKWGVSLSLLTLLLNAWLIGSVTTAKPSGHTSADFHLRVVSLNVLTSNHDHDGVLRYLQGADADVIFLMEVDDLWAGVLKPLIATHPHHVLHPRADNFGVAFFSRVPLESLRVLTEEDLGIAGFMLPFVQAHLRHGEHEMIFVGTHPLPPTGRAYSANRDLQLQGMSLRISQQHQPVLLIGDLNVTPWSHGISLLTSGSGLRLAPNAWEPTWRSSSLFAIPIDHALTTTPLTITTRQVGPDVGSDHRPQVIELGWIE